jgi:hypothetical protein
MTDEKIFSKYFEHLYNGHCETVDMLVEDALANSKTYKQARNWVTKHSKGYDYGSRETRIVSVGDCEAWNDILNKAQKRIVRLALDQKINHEEF